MLMRVAEIISEIVEAAVQDSTFRPREREPGAANKIGPITSERTQCSSPCSAKQAIARGVRARPCSRQAPQYGWEPINIMLSNLRLWLINRPITKGFSISDCGMIARWRSTEPIRPTKTIHDFSLARWHRGLLNCKLTAVSVAASGAPMASVGVGVWSVGVASS